MIRLLLSCTLIAVAAACGPVAEESDDPGALPSPTPSDVSTAPAPPPPAGVVKAGWPPEFAQCTICHKVEPGANALGPSLAGVFGAKAGHVGDFAYSAAMRSSGLVWDEATLDRYLEAPARTVPGTKMAYAGLKDPARRQAVIDYLKTL